MYIKTLLWAPKIIVSPRHCISVPKDSITELSYILSGQLNNRQLLRFCLDEQ